MEYTFHIYNKMASDGISLAANTLLSTAKTKPKINTLNPAILSKKEETRGAGMSLTQKTAQIHTQNPKQNFSQIPTQIPVQKQTIEKPPVIVCVGSDLAIGDSLGPITGSMLKFKTQGLHVFLYGTLSAPVTAKEIKYMRTFLNETHQDRQIIAIDAAVGNQGDIGLIKATSSPLLPGAGANKQLGSIGDISILGIVAEKSLSNYGLFNTTRLNLVYTMAEIISDALAALLWEKCSRYQDHNIKNA